MTVGKKKTLGAFLLMAVLLAVSSVHAAEGGGSHYSPGFYGDFGVAVAPDHQLLNHP